MAIYTHRVETIDGKIIAWIDRDGQQMIMQPHHPASINLEPWSSVEEAESWANEEKTRIAESEAAAIAAREQAALDSQRLAEIHSMLVQLTSK